MRVLISQGGLSPHPEPTAATPVVSWRLSPRTVFAVGVGLFAEYPPTTTTAITSPTTEASYARLIRLIPIPVMIARHIFLMTGGNQSVLKHAKPSALPLPQRAGHCYGGGGNSLLGVSTPPLCIRPLRPRRNMCSAQFGLVSTNKKKNEGKHNQNQ